MRKQELIVYRNLEQESILRDMTWLMQHYGDDYYNLEDRTALLYDCMLRLLELSVSHGFYGNLWHCYLANLLANDENCYSTACEVTGPVVGTINETVLHDFQILKEIYDYDFTDMTDTLGIQSFSLLLEYERTGSKAGSKVYNTRIRDRICQLAVKVSQVDTPQEMKKAVTEFYQEYGVGKFGLHKAFRIDHGKKGAKIRPILNIAHVKLDDLVGYEIPKQKLIDNTEAFVEGRAANNCLLFGYAGTGKSSSIKAIANAYYDRGLRIIEIYKHQFRDLNDVIAQIKNRNYKFIIYMDDLSFEDFETEYKYLKAVIEGGLEKKPDNVLIYATSNRRHLVRERFSDKEDRNDDLHTNDTVQEKLSLVARFGVTIFFDSPDKKQFQDIVTVLAERAGITMPQEELLAEANKWELNHGGLSGRCAQQFIDYLSGKKAEG